MRTRTIVARRRWRSSSRSPSRRGVWATRGGDDPDGWSTAAGTPPGRTGDAAIAGDGTVVAVWTEERRGLTARDVVRAPAGRPLERPRGHSAGAALGRLRRVRGRRVARGRGGDVPPRRPPGRPAASCSAHTARGAGSGRRPRRSRASGATSARRPSPSRTTAGWEWSPRRSGPPRTSTPASATRARAGATRRERGARLRVIARPRVAMSSGAGAYVAAVEGFGRRTRLRVYTHGDGRRRRPGRGSPRDQRGRGRRRPGPGRRRPPGDRLAPPGSAGRHDAPRQRARAATVEPPRTLDRGPIVTSFGPIAASSARRRGRRGMEPVGAGVGPGSRSAQPP